MVSFEEKDKPVEVSEYLLENTVIAKRGLCRNLASAAAYQTRNSVSVGHRQAIDGPVRTRVGDTR